MSDPLRKTVAYGVYALAGLGAIVGTSLGKMYAPAFAAALGFIAPIPADLTPEQQKRLERADSRVSSAFLTDAQIALRDSPLYVADLGDAAIAGVHYAGDRIIARSSFENSSIDRIVFHESMHHLFKRGLIDATAFKTAYDLMSSAEYPIKARIKERLASYTDPSDLNEIAAHTAELIFYDGLEASPDVEEVLSQCVDLSASRIKRTKRLTK